MFILIMCKIYRRHRNFHMLSGDIPNNKGSGGPLIIFVLVDDVNRSSFDEDMRENDFYILFLSDLDLIL